MRATRTTTSTDLVSDAGAEVHGPFTVTVATEADQLITLPFDEFSRHDLHWLSPVRFPTSHSRRTNKIGHYWSSTCEGSLVYESGLEHQALIGWDFDPRVEGISTQPFELGYYVDGKKARPITPDALLVFRNGQIGIREVKPISKVADADVQRKLAAGRAAVTAAGWSWEIEPELPPVLGRNLRWLSGYRRLLWDPADTRSRLAAGATEPIEFGELLDQVRGGPIATAVLMRMLWTHELVADLASSLLDLDTLVVVPNHRDRSGTFRYAPDGLVLTGAFQ
jgi:hypothetical protein